MLLIHLLLMSIIPLLAIPGLFNDKFGLVNIWEMYYLGALYGLNIGSVQSYSRSMFTLMIPKKRESQFFGLYEITDKGSSWIGPLMVAMVSNYYKFCFSIGKACFILHIKKIHSLWKIIQSYCIFEIESLDLFT